MKNAKLILATGNGYPVSTEEQIPLIKKAGFDGVFTGWSDNAPIAEWAKIVADNGMIYQSLHAPFNRANLMWEPGEAGDSGIAAVQVITCGGYHGDTLTVSSAMDGGMASLQRQILRIDGSVCTPCEVPLGSFSGDLQQRLLLAALALRQGRLREV